MLARLGFAIASDIDPDVLVVDEALAVGDGYFQKKCVDKILEILFRSPHSVGQDPEGALPCVDFHHGS